MEGISLNETMYVISSEKYYPLAVQTWIVNFLEIDLMRQGYVKKYDNDFVPILDYFPYFEKVKGGSVHVTAVIIQTQE